MFFTSLRQNHIFGVWHFFSGRGIWGMASQNSLFIHPFSPCVEIICWTVHLFARNDQVSCQVNDVCGVSDFCTWLWMLRFIRCNYWEEEARSVFCLFHAPADFVIQWWRWMPMLEAPASTLLLYMSDHHPGKFLSHCSLLYKIHDFSPHLWGCFAVAFHFTDAAQTLLFFSQIA